MAIMASIVPSSGEMTSGGFDRYCSNGGRRMSEGPSEEPRGKGEEAKGG